MQAKKVEMQDNSIDKEYDFADLQNYMQLNIYQKRLCKMSKNIKYCQ